MKRINLLKKEKGQFFPIVHWSSIRFPSAGLLWPGHFSEVQRCPYFPSQIPEVKGQKLPCPIRDCCHAGDHGLWLVRQETWSLSVTSWMFDLD